MRFAIVNGYTGTGRTTGVVNLVRRLNEVGVKAAMLTNDVGSVFADDRLANASSIPTGLVGNDCLGCQSANLVAELRRLRDQEGVDLVVAEMPPICVCASDHVYGVLDDRYEGEFDLCPFTVVITAEQVRSMEEEACAAPEDVDDVQHEMNYVYARQLSGADLVILNKCDLLEKEEVEHLVGFLEASFPHARVVPLSFLDSDDIASFADIMLSESSVINRVWDETDKELFARAEKYFAYYNQTVYLSSRTADPIDFPAFAADYVRAVRAMIASAGGRVIHVKVIAEMPSKYERDVEGYSALGIDGELEPTCRFDKEHAALRMSLNIRYAGEAQPVLRNAITCIDDVAETHDLDLEIYMIECFTMPDVVKRHYTLLKKNDHDEL